MKKRLLALLLTVVLAASGFSAPALACTSLYVGGDLTANGSTYYGRSEDIGALYNKIFEVRQAADHAEGEMFQDAYGFCMPYPAHTYRYTMVRDPIAYGDTTLDEDGNILIEAFAEAGINEKGVSICATVSTGYAPILDEVDPAVEAEYDEVTGELLTSGGLCELSIATVVLQQASSAREGVELLAELIDTYGAGNDYGCFNSVLIGDGDEVWHFQGLSGHQYVAVRQSPDTIAINPNMLTLGEVDIADTENVVASPDLISLPLENGFLVSPQYNGETHEVSGDAVTRINIRDTYGCDDGAGQYTRYWQGLNYFAPALAEDFTGELEDYCAAYELYYADYLSWYYATYYPEYGSTWEGEAPDPAGYGLEMFSSADNGGGVYYTFQPQADSQPITTFDALRFLAQRGEDTAFDSNADPGVYPIGNENQSECHIFELRKDLPAELATVEWLAMDRAEYNVYLPFYCALITDTSDLYKCEYVMGDGQETAMDVIEAPDSPMGESLFWVCACLNDLCDDDRETYGANVRAFWDGYQQSLIDQQTEVDAVMLSLYGDGSDSEVALSSRTATALGVDLTEQTFAVASDILEQLAAFINAGETGVFTPDVAQSEPEYKIALTDEMFTVDAAAETYTGSPVTKTVETPLVEGRDYTVTYENNTDVGTATLTITGVGACKGTLTFSFAIEPAEDTLTLDQSAAQVRVGRSVDVNAAVTGYEGLDLYAVSSDTAVATVSVADMTVTVQGVARGDATVYVVMADAAPLTVDEAAANPSAQELAVTVTKTASTSTSGRSSVSPATPEETPDTPEETPAAKPASEVFADVEKDSWYEPGVTFVTGKGLFLGVDDGVFAPEINMSRAMLMTVLARLNGADTDGGETWYEKGMAWAMENGVSDGSDPDAPITREQLATMLYRYEQLQGGGFTGNWMFLLDFTDRTEVSQWAYEAVCYMTMHGVMEGKGEKVLDPQGTATRAEVATMLQRFCEGER